MGGGWRTAGPIGLAVAALCSAGRPPVVAASVAASVGASVTLTGAPPEIRFAGAIGLSGAVIGAGGAPLAGAPVELQADPFPYRGFFDAAHATTAADGTYRFPAQHPDRNTRYRVRAPGVLSRPSLVYVDSPGILHSYDRGPGRVMLTMLSYHSAYFRWIRVPTYWYVTTIGSSDFHLVAITRTRELKPGVTYATATIDPPAGRFTFRVCFNGAGQAGAGPPADRAPCPHADFRAQPPAR